MRGGAGAIENSEDGDKPGYGMALNHHLALIGIVTCGVGYFMALAGIHKSALEWRRRRRRCPSCGREIVARVCPCSN